MHIRVNGVIHELHAAHLAQALEALDYRHASVATALNGMFVPASARQQTLLADGDVLEVLAPMQGG